MLRVLEKAFREYTRQLVAHSPYPLVVVYKPQTTISFNPLVFESPTASKACLPPTLTIQPLTPRLYASITHYKEASDGFSAALESNPTNAGPSCHLWASDHEVMNQLLTSAGLSVLGGAANDRNYSWKVTIMQSVIKRLRKTSEMTFMDKFIYLKLDEKAQIEYQVAIIQHLLSKMLPLESPAIVALCFILSISVTFGGFLSLAHTLLPEEISWAWKLLLPSPKFGTVFFGGWAMSKFYIEQYYLNPFCWGQGH